MLASLCVVPTVPMLVVAAFEAPLAIGTDTGGSIRQPGAVTGTVVLVAWSAGIGVAAALVCYALALDVPSTLMAFGAVLGVALWSGPGASRFRSPVSRDLDPASRSTLPRLFTCAGLLAVAALLGVLVAGRGVSWLPWSGGPFGL